MSSAGNWPSRTGADIRLVALGYPKDDDLPLPKHRLSMDEIVMENRWGEPLR
jgi:hypothetical protein